MTRLRAFVALLAAAACVCASAKQPGVQGKALAVPSGGTSKPRGGVAGVTASLDARAALSLTFNAKALDREERASFAAPATTTADRERNDNASALKRATDAQPAELPLPKVRHVARKLHPALRRLMRRWWQGAAAAGFERATVAHSPRAVTVTLYRIDGAPSPVPSPVTSGAVCVAAFGVVATIAAALAGAAYLISGGI